jgi:ABC-type phosphate transport system substrate-binding protein
MGLAITGTLGAALTMVASATPAFADYAPSSKDVVGVGSDTLQYLGDFIADGDFLGDAGYNSLGNKYKIVNFDATTDANARLAYGPQGVGSGQCAPGTGGTQGTGNQTTTHADQPCTLDPTIVLRAGFNPVLRPNGTGAGAAALLADGSAHLITYSRASACQGPTAGCGSLTAAYDSITVGNDPLAMLTGTTTNAPALSTAQLTAIYSCTDTTWTQVGGSSATTIIPILPQIGSGTRKAFLAAISVTTPGSCVVNAEENDPTAIAAQVRPADAIEPMSGGRLNLYQGLLGTGGSNGVGGYFKDPSCALDSTTNGCTATINPAVSLVTTGTPSDGHALFDISRPLYIYFRASDVSSTTVWQPGGTLNAVRTLFYNPCPDNPPVAGDGCTTVNGVTFGPGGAPFYATPAGQSLIASAGVSPTYAATVGGP